MIRINKNLSIDENDIIFTFSRSTGPGGQNVNKLNTRATLYFDLAKSRSLTSYDRKRILDKYPSRINTEGIMRVISQKHRTQKANKIAAMERFTELLSEALSKRTPRKKTSVPRSSVEKRLSLKKQRSAIKKQRSTVRQQDQF